MKTLLPCVLVGMVEAFSFAGEVGTMPADDKNPPFQVCVDPRVELMSIIFRLAGNSEYNRARIDSYTKDVDKQFLPFKDHEVVQLARKLRKTRGVSYDAPMSLVVHVTDAFSLKEKVPFKPHPQSLDRRWRLGEVREFLEKARAFVKQSKFREFVRAHQGLYDQVGARLSETLIQHGHFEWFDRFFGKRSGESFNVFAGMLNGPCNYGGRVSFEGKQELYCILGVSRSDKKGIPRFPKTVLPTVVHEFAHSYVNPLVVKHAADFEKPGKKIFRRHKRAMIRQAYGNWHTMVHESIVRACVVRYRKKNEGILAAGMEIARQRARSFVWVGELSKLLAEYETQREKYPDFETFIPRIVEVFEGYAEKLDEPHGKMKPFVQSDPSKGS